MHHLLTVSAKQIIPDNAEDLDIVVSVHDLIEYSDNYANISASLWQNFRDEPNDIITDSESFKFKSRFTINNDNAATANVVVLLKYLSKFWRSLEILLMNSEVTFDLTWSANSVICKEDEAAILEIANAKLYI